MSTRLSYATKQMIHTLSDNGESIRTIMEALGLSYSSVQRTLKEEIEPSALPEIIGDGCYHTSTETGEQESTSPEEYYEEEGYRFTKPGQLTKLESGYPDIYYNEQTKRWEVWLSSKRVWRATNLTKACEFRLSKGSLSKNEEKLLQEVVNAPPELQEALNFPPI